MANHRSAEKRARQALVRRARNRSIMSGVRTAVKKVDTAVSEQNKDAAQSALNSAISAIASASSKGALHKNTAGRNVSRLTLRVNRMG